MLKQEEGKIIKMSFMRDFKDTLKQCEGYLDDRGLFKNWYNQLLEAIEEFYRYEIKSPIIRIAFNDKFDKEFKELKLLEISLKNRNMVH
jgi:hypothetical protein